MARKNEKQLDNVTLEGVRLVFRNFSGKEGRFNRKGDRNFAVILPDELVPVLEADGWPVNFLKPREEGDEPAAFMKVKVNYSGRPPRVVMITSRGRVNLDEDAIETLDWAVIRNADLIIRPYHYDVNGKTGISCYLNSLYVTIEEDELEQKYSDVPDSAQSAMFRGFEEEN